MFDIYVWQEVGLKHGSYGGKTGKGGTPEAGIQGRAHIKADKNEKCPQVSYFSIHF